MNVQVETAIQLRKLLCRKNRIQAQAVVLRKLLAAMWGSVRNLDKCDGSRLVVMTEC